MDQVQVLTARINTLARNLFSPLWHICLGIRDRRIPYFVYGISLALMLTENLGLDQMFLGRLGFVNLAGFLMRFEVVYFALLGLSPFLVWVAVTFVRFQGIRAILARDFEELGLRTVKGRLPQLVGFEHVDDTSRALTIRLNGVPFEDFKSKRTALASKFGVFITSIEERRTKGKLQIQFTPFEIPRYVKMDEPGTIRGFMIRVGYGAGKKPVDVSLRDVPHFLVGGSTKMGKSTFFRQAITTLLYGNRPHIQIVFIDLKDGLEAEAFRGIEGVTTVKDVPAALDSLQSALDEMHYRTRLFAEVGAQNIDHYHERLRELGDEIPGKSKHGTLPRMVIFIDEAFELFTVGRADGKKASEAKSLCITLAAQGRASGIHLVIGTQRPDASTIDTRIKGNLTGRICFHTADNPSSMVILDSVRAADLSPKDKGRAIWKSGPDLEEVQTPNFPPEDAELYLKPLRKNDGNVLPESGNANEDAGKAAVSGDKREADDEAAAIVEAR